MLQPKVLVLLLKTNLSTWRVLFVWGFSQETSISYFWGVGGAVD